MGFRGPLLDTVETGQRAPLAATDAANVEDAVNQVHATSVLRRASPGTACPRDCGQDALALRCQQLGRGPCRLPARAAGFPQLTVLSEDDESRDPCVATRNSDRVLWLPAKVGPTTDGCYFGVDHTVRVRQQRDVGGVRPRHVENRIGHHGQLPKSTNAGWAIVLIDRNGAHKDRASPPLVDGDCNP